jgi:hypothetical protein
MDGDLSDIRRPAWELVAKETHGKGARGKVRTHCTGWRYYGVIEGGFPLTVLANSGFWVFSFLSHGSIRRVLTYINLLGWSRDLLF